MSEGILTRRVSIDAVEAELLADIEVTGSAVTQVDITGLNTTEDDEILLVSDIVNPLGSSISYSLYANGNVTATNYYRQELFVSGTTKLGERLNDSLAFFVSNNQKTLTFSNIKLTESGYFTTQNRGVLNYGGSGVAIISRYNTSTFTMASITSLNIISAIASGIGVGSRFQLYKIGGA